MKTRRYPSSGLATERDVQAAPDAPSCTRLSSMVALACLLAGGASMRQVWGAPTPAGALPVGGVVSAGSATIGAPSGDGLTIHQSSPQAVIDWRSFDIGAQAAVRFVQPDAASSVLNRVLSNEPSQIYGQLSANGRLYLVNPSGVVFGAGARADASALVASTLDISNADFMSGRDSFTRGAAAGTVRNDATLEAAPGGYIALLGATVDNSGTLRAPGGRVLLAAGEALRLPLSNSGLVTLEVAPAAINAAVANHAGGVIEAAGGQVYLSAAAGSGVTAQVLNQGRIAAVEGGKVQLAAFQADGAGETRQAGRIDVASTEAAGGEVRLLGDRVGLFAGATVDATGAAGGGTVLAGGAAHGQGTERNAGALYMDQGAVIDVSATRRGAGGTAVLWSQDYTGFYGTVVARGGAQGGAGGFVETSGARLLSAFGRVDAAAPHGAAGQWLLDPTDVSIVSGAVNSNDSVAAGVWTPTTDSAQIGVANINADLNAGTSVVINTTSAGAGTGNITVNAGANLSKTAGGNAALTLNAAGAITLNGHITATTGTLATTLNAAGGGIGGTANIALNGGLLTLNASGNGTLSGIISGSGGLLHSGAGVTTLTGANTYSGANSISNGTLQIGNGTGIGALGSGAVALAGGATLAWNNTVSNVTRVISNVISGAGTVRLLGLHNAAASPWSTYQLTGNNVGLSGVIQANGARLRTSASSALGTAGVEVEAFGQLWVTGGLTIANPITIQQNASGWYTGQVLGAINAEGDNTFSGALVLNDLAPMTLGDSSGQHATIGSFNAGTTTFSGVISGPGGFKMSRWNANSTVGALTNVVFSGTASNTYTGTTVVDGQGGLATLMLAKTGGAVAIAAGNVVQFGIQTTSQANLRMGADNQFGADVQLKFANPFGHSGRFDLLGTSQTLGSIVGGSSTLASNGIIENGGLNAPGSGNAVLTLSGAGSYLYNGILRDADPVGGGSATLSLVHSGSGSQVVGRAAGSGELSYSGPTTVSAGTLDLLNANGYNSATTVAAGASLNSSGSLNADTGANAMLTLNGGSYNHSSSKYFAWGGGLNVTANSVINVSNSGSLNQVYFGGATLAGAADLTINNSGAAGTGVRFRGTAAGTYSGTLTVNGGSIGSQNGMYSFENAGVTLNGANWYLDGAQSVSGLASDEHVKSLNGSGNIFLGARTLTVGSNSGSGLFSGVISGTGRLAKTGNGTQILTGANTYTGTTTIGGGVLQIGNGGTTGSLATTSAITNDASLVFSRSNAYSIGNPISGSGTLTASSGAGLSINGAVNLAGDITLSAGTASPVAATNVANGAVTGGDLVLNAAVSATGAGKTVAIYSGNATSTLNTARVAGSANSLNKVYATAAGAGTLDPNKKLNLFYRLNPPSTLSFSAANRAYNGGVDASVTPTLTGSVDGDVLAVGYSGASFATPNAGNGIVVTVDGINVASSTPGVTVSGYARTTTATTSANITASSLTVYANNDAKFVTKADVPNYAGVSFSGFVNGETPAVLGGTATVIRSNVGTELAGSYAGVLQASGLTSSNYSLSYVPGRYTITAANELQVKYGSFSNFYGVTPNYGLPSAEYMLPNGTVVQLSPTQIGNQFSVSDGAGGSASFSVAPVSPAFGTGGALAAGSYQLDHGAVSGSSVNFSNNLTLTGAHSVYALGVSVAAGAVSKVYDAGFGMNLQGLTLNTPLNNDLLSLNGVGNFATRNAGNNLTYTVNNLSLGGADAANYYLSGGVSSISGVNGTITPAPLVLSAVGDSKVYDAGLASAGVPSVSGLQGQDSVTGLAQSYLDRNVGSAKGLQVDGGYVVNDGNGGLNYTVSSVASSGGVITAAPLTLSAGDGAGNGKVYDATRAGAVQAPAGLMGGDTVTGLSASYDSMHAGSGKALSVNPGYVVADGNGGHNYNVTVVNASDGVITPAPLTLSAVAASRSYDGSANSAGVPMPGAGQLKGSDTLDQLSQRYLDKNAGTGKTLRVATYRINDGLHDGDYAITLVDSAAGEIVPAALSVTANTASKPYDGQTGTPGVTPLLAGLVSGDLADAPLQAYASADAGTSKVITPVAVTIRDAGGADMSANYSISYVSVASGSITPVALKVFANHDAKFVTEADLVNFAGASYSGFVNGDSPAVLGGALSITRSNASVQAAGDYAGVLNAGGLTSGNYTIHYIAGDYSIVPANQLLVRLDPVTTLYGTVPSLSVRSAEYLLPNGNVVALAPSLVGDQFSVSDGAGAAISFPVVELAPSLSGAGALRVGVYQLGHGTVTGNASNFSHTLTVTGAHTVDPLAVAIGAGGVSKVYDASRSMDGLTLNLSTKLSGDALTVGGVGSFASQNAGSNLAYTVSNLALGGADASNYVLSGGLTSLTGSNGMISPAPLTLSAVDASKIYDKSLHSDGVPLVSGQQGNDTVTLLTQSYVDGNAGTDKLLKVNPGYTIQDGNGGLNYTVSTVNALGGVITPAPLTLSAGDGAANRKEYDATLAGPVQAPLGLLAGDTVTGLSASYDSIHAGTGKSLSVNPGYAVIDGNGGHNYTVTLVNPGNGVITPAPLTLSAVAASRAYDGSTTSTGMPTIAAGQLKGSDSVDQLSQHYLDKNAGSGKTLRVATYRINDGLHDGDYALTLVGSAAGEIVPAALTVTATPVSKAYDGLTGTLGATPLVTGLVLGDVLGLPGQQAYADPNAGTGKTVTPSGVLVRDSGGADMGANYAINYVASTAGAITPVPLTVTVNHDARFVTQADSANFAGAGYSGFVNGENAAVLGGALTIARSNAAVQAPGNYTGVLLASGLSSGNYAFHYVAGDYSIVPANSLLVRLAPLSTSYGTAAPFSVQSAEYLLPDGAVVALAPTLAGNRFSVSDGAGGAVSFSILDSAPAYSSSGALKVGVYQATHGEVVGNSDNFSNALTLLGSHSVVPRSVSLGVGGVHKTYDANSQIIGVTPGLSGQLAGDLLLADADGNYRSRNAGAALSYAFSNLVLRGADAANYTLDGAGATVGGNDGVITPAPLTISAVAVNKLYDAQRSVAATPLVEGLLGADTLEALHQRFEDRHAGVGKALTVDPGYVLVDGNGGANYRVQLVDAVGTIAPAPLLITAVAGSKVYDATLAGPVAPRVEGLRGGDTVSALGEHYTDRHAGTGKTLLVDPGFVVEDGNRGGNYRVSTVASGEGAITPAPLTITLLADSKIYDATTAAAALPQVSGLQGGDTLLGLAERYADKHAGDQKPLQLAPGYAINDGNGGANYALQLVAEARGTIAARPVTLTAPENILKQVDGDTSVPAEYRAVQLGGIGEPLLGAQLSFATPEPGSGKTVNIGPAQIDDGNQGRNYILTLVPGRYGRIEAPTPPLLNLLQQTNPAGLLPVSLEVPMVLEGRLLADGLIDLGQVLPRIPELGLLTAVGDAQGRPVAGLNLDALSALLQFDTSADLSSAMLATQLDRKARLRTIRLRLLLDVTAK